MKDYTKYFKLKASPDLVYKAFTNPFTLELWTDEPAVMSTEPNQEFSWFDGAITGVNIRFEEDFLIEQQWFFGNQEQPSVVTMKFHPDKKGTSVELKQTNIPNEAFQDIIEGWEEIVFGSLKEYYSED